VHSRGARRLKGLWRHADFMKLWTGQSISELGSRITRDGLPLAAVLVLRATPSQMGLLTAVGSAPVLLTGLLAGVWVDRLPRRPILIAADLGRAAVLASIPVAALLGLLNIWQLCIVLALTGILTVFFDVAYEAYLPCLVERENIVEGNTKLALSSAAAEVAGPGLAGFLIQAVTAPVAILLDALSFLLSVLTLAVIRKPEPPPAPAGARKPLGHEIAQGMRAIWGNKVLRAFILGGGTRSFFGNFYGALYGLYAIRELGMGPAALGLTIAMGGVGDLIGALVAGRLVRRYGLGRTLIGTFALSSSAAFLIPLARGPVLLAVILLMAAQLVGDMLRTVYTINEVSVRQTITPDRLLGRTNASMQLSEAGVGPFGALAGGILGEMIGLRATLALAAIGSLAACLWLLFSPVRNLGEALDSFMLHDPLSD
jgi:predicted MFS family arabinose efflux permease